MTTPRDWITLDARLLRDWPLPEAPADADKEARGRVLVVAGSREIPGAALLAAVGALRAGAGKLVIATAASVAQALALAVPEAQVIALPETPEGAFAPEALGLLEETARSTGATLVGPGMMDSAGTRRFVAQLLPLLAHAPVVLDALAMDVVLGGFRFEQPVLLTPHAGEMAHLRGDSKEAVGDDPKDIVVAAADEWRATVALKGATTFIAGADGGRWRHTGGQPGLATSGSGDVLAGLIAGMAAQQVPLEQACAWGVLLHAQAGAVLGRRFGPVGFLARELSEEIPGLLHVLQQRSHVRTARPAPRAARGGTPAGHRA